MKKAILTVKKNALKILKDSQYTLDYYINDEDKSINGVKVVGVLNADGKQINIQTFMYFLTVFII